MEAPSSIPRLRSLPWGARIGLTAVLIVFAMGLAASLAHIWYHDHNRDEDPELTFTDLEAAYHGVQVQSPLLAAIERGHPPELPAAARDDLLAWLRSDKISERYDDLDLGERAPSELLAVHCLSCHGASVAASKGANLTLDRWDSVRKVAFSKDLSPPPLSVLVASTHAHALTLAAIAALLIVMLAMSRWSRAGVAIVGFLLGVGLFVDIGGWWVARSSQAFVVAVALGGAIFTVSTALALLLLLLELWLPIRVQPSARS
jgi:hypothetical protein